MWLNFVKVDLFAIYIFLILCFIIFIYRKATLLKSQEIDIHERYLGKALMSVDGVSAGLSLNSRKVRTLDWIR